MQPAAETIQRQLAHLTLQAPKIPILHNVDVKIHSDAASIKQILIQQLISPVRWVDTIQAFSATGVTNIVECGPGKVLAGLNKRINSNLQQLSLADSEAIRQAVNNLS
jgi:[acyl-carrier-protein] S-malonyltransferase